MSFIPHNCLSLIHLLHFDTLPFFSAQITVNPQISSTVTTAKGTVLSPRPTFLSLYYSILWDWNICYSLSNVFPGSPNWASQRDVDPLPPPPHFVWPEPATINTLLLMVGVGEHKHMITHLLWFQGFVDFISTDLTSPQPFPHLQKNAVKVVTLLFLTT